MRGKGVRHSSKHAKRRITPAYAGKRSTAETLRAREKDHPCVCGEKIILGQRLGQI